MNLTTDPWIPVIAADGSQCQLSLLELFACADELRDLSAKPHEKIALLRLLICITQAALDGPEDFEAWEACRKEIQPKAKLYLEKWKDRFELFGDGPRFLQVPGLMPAKADGPGNPATKLDLTLASGNNPTTFDNAAGDTRRVRPERLPLALLTFQCFSPGGRIGVANWGGEETIGKGSANHAPCTPSGMLHTYLQGHSLLDTLHLNLTNKEAQRDLPGEGWGRPVWEMMVERGADKPAIANATKTYLGRLVPLSRAIKLQPDGLEILLANGIEYPLFPTYREPAATVVSRDEGPAILGVSLGRSLWRQLTAITVKRRSNTDLLSGPLALSNLTGERGATLWIGALATDKAKIEDVVEAAYEIPAGMFRDAGRKLYEEGIALADAWQESLSKSIKNYAAALKLNPVPYERGRQHFWTVVEQHVPKLLSLASAPESAGDLKETEWGVSVKKAAHAAYEFACPRQSPRQIEAFAIGRQQLLLSKPKNQKSK